MQVTSQGTLGLFVPLTQDHELLDIVFADEASFIVRVDHHSLTLDSLSIDKFCMASGGLVNWIKSKSLWIGAHEDMPVCNLDGVFL